MSLKNKFKNFFSLEDEEYEYEYIETDREELLKNRNQRQNRLPVKIGGEAECSKFAKRSKIF